MKDWKACERRIAELLGGRRVPVTGRQRGDAPDIEHEALSIEVKSRKALPAWLMGALEQAQTASKNGKMPVVVLHQDHRPYTESLILLRLSDFADYLKGEGLVDLEAVERVEAELDSFTEKRARPKTPRR